jgi:hypothetical protein
MPKALKPYPSHWLSSLDIVILMRDLFITLDNSELDSVVCEQIHLTL